MNSTPEEHDPFERQLAEFEHAPLPKDWKSELIDNAIAHSPAAEKNIVAFSLFQKISLGGIAACWAAIALLRLTMPAETVPGTASSATLSAAPGEAADSTSLPMLVHYIEIRNTLTSQF